jgi:hypothetical protein
MFFTILLFVKKFNISENNITSVEAAKGTIVIIFQPNAKGGKFMNHEEFKYLFNIKECTIAL